MIALWARRGATTGPTVFSPASFGSRKGPGSSAKPAENGLAWTREQKGSTTGAAVTVS